MNGTKQFNTILAAGLIIVGVLLRIIPHPPNVTPIAAIALLGGAYIGKKYLAFLIPLAALFLSDVLLNNTINKVYFTDSPGFVLWSPYMAFTYAAFLLMVLIGIVYLKKPSFFKNILGAVGASVLFFFVSNIGVWIMPGGYPETLGGLVTCLTAGLPFFRNTLVGNVVYVIVFFSAFSYIQKVYLSKNIARVNNS